MSHQRAVADPPVATAALKGLCPRCGSATLFDGVAQVAPACPACGLDFAALAGGDRLTGFLTMIAAALMAGAAVAVDRAMRLPLWLQLALWIPLTVIAILLLVRVTKGVRLTLRYRADGERSAGA